LLFSKKKKEDKEKEELKGAMKRASEESAEKSEVGIEELALRISTIMGKMYRMILSVSIPNNVCQIEYGDRYLYGSELPVRMFFDAFIDRFALGMHPDDAENFRNDFSRVKLAEALTAPGGFFQGIYCVRTEAVFEEDGAPDLTYYELRAEKIPGNEAGVRCMIYIREVDAKAKTYSAAPAKKAENKFNEEGSTDWNDVRISRFFGGSNVIYFEYDSEEDTLYLHYDQENSDDDKVLANYVKNIENRSDWSIFHGDTNNVKRAMQNASKGKSTTEEIRYRANGRKDTAFRYYKFAVSPAEDTVPSRWAVGLLTDIDEEVRKRNTSRDIASHIDNMMGTLFTDLFELDIERDLIYKIVRSDDGFQREDNPNKLSDYINTYVANGVIEPGSAVEYKKWTEKGYLEHQTLRGDFEFESRLKLPGSTEYRWFSERISKFEGGRRFLRMRRDINELQEIRHREYELEEQARYGEYNRRMLDLMASLVEFRNVESGPHIQHVRKLTRILLEDLAKRSPLYDITPHMIDIYSEAATMHDIGKIVVPDYILNKAGRYTPEERSIMQRHTTDGARIVDRLELPGQEELVAACRDVALHHHERYDGTGYPEGLVGDANNIYTQAVGLADVYDALVSVRCYKEGMSHDDAVQSIINGEGGSFNPRLLESFKICKNKMFALYEESIKQEKL